MCKKCKVVIDDAINHKGYVYICQCGHKTGYDIQDFGDWDTRYLEYAMCHYCKSAKIVLRQDYIQLIMDSYTEFEIHGAL